MKRVLFFIFLVVILGACGEYNKDTSYAERDEGFIVNIKKDTDNEAYDVLTLPSVENMNILDKTRDELIKLAEENDGAIYRVSQEQYEEWELEVGQRIVGYYTMEGQSIPPVFYIEKIEVILEQ